MLVIYLLNVLTVFAGISMFIGFLHLFAAMKRCFGYGAMAGLPIVIGLAWALLQAGPDQVLLMTVGKGFLIAFCIMVVMSIAGGVLLGGKLTASEAANGYLGLRPILVTFVGCALYILLILGLNTQAIGQMNFWSDAANIEKYGTPDGGH